jgi:hypothetical protein
MPFDFTIAVAKLDLGSGTDRPDLDGLRAQYPELRFVFDMLEEKIHAEEHARLAQREEEQEIRSNYEVAIDDLECRVQDMRLAFEQIRHLTIDAHITEIVEGIL